LLLFNVQRVFYNAFVPTSIIATKLYIPPSRSEIVLRPRLTGQLNTNRHRKLTLVVAPAGFGKSTLVSEWVAAGRRPVAWLSLDEEESDLARFLTYLIAALQTITGEIGALALPVLQSSPPLPIEAILTNLINDIAASPHDFILVLDDYHLVDNPSVDKALSFLLERLPPSMHLVITTREDPNLPLARLRVRDQLTELRVADLRFTPSEAAEFLNQVMGLALSADEVAALDSRTEGWIAGLQLAALSMKGNQDVTGFIQAFTGDHRYIVDYLVEEVLKNRPESLRRFLLQTSILDRLNGPLCDAVTGQPGGATQLEALQRGNFFLIPLDDRRHWYRYHHLFADVLRAHLMTEQPDQLSILHGRASKWYEQNGSAPEAIHHALAAGDFERAAALIEQALPAARQSRQEAMLLSWLQALPDDAFQHRPVLSVHYAGVLLQNGQLEGVEARLRAAERWLGEDVGMRPVFADEEEFQRLPGSVAMYHAAIALIRGDVAGAMSHARRVIELTRDDDYFMRGAASSLMGLAAWTSGDLATAYRTYADGMTYLHKAGYISDVTGGAVSLADIRLTQGRLREAFSHYERGLQLATQPGRPALRGAADMHVGLSEIYRERNELDRAGQHLLKSVELGELNSLPKNPYRWRVASARLAQAQGDIDGALDLLDEAEPLYVGDFSPNVRPVAALRARLWVAAGRLGDALGWARERGLSAGDDLSYLREFEHITLARLLLSQARVEGSDSALREAAIGLLERLLQAAEKGGRMGSVVEILVLQSLAYQLEDDIPAALAPLERALTLAEPEGYVRLFLDEGTGMAHLIGEAAGQGIMPAYTGKLLAAFAAGHQALAGEITPPAPPASSSLLDPLSQRELEILRLFKTELSGPEIAQELVIALSTVRTHTKSIYGKLNVNSRRAAVRRAVELGLI
jgi:LuxR family maltose regulon positive regulatory protein